MEPIWVPYGNSCGIHMVFHVVCTRPPIWASHGQTMWVLCGYHMVHTCGLPLWNPYGQTICMPHEWYVAHPYDTHMGGRVQTTWNSARLPYCLPMWVPYGKHMWFTTVKPIWANHMYATWVTYGSPMWHPYGWSGANHMKFHTFAILSSYVGTTWYTHVVYQCETHMGKPYVCHMSDIWLTHVTPIWVVGCKPHEIPHVCHIVFLYWSHMDSIYDVGRTLSAVHCFVPGMATTLYMYITDSLCSNQIKSNTFYFRQLHVQHFLTSCCKVKQMKIFLHWRHRIAKLICLDGYVACYAQGLKNLGFTKMFIDFYGFLFLGFFRFCVLV